jgi:hypothetical protein
MNSLDSLPAQSRAIQRTPGVMWQFAMALTERCRAQHGQLRWALSRDASLFERRLALRQGERDT